jgi:cation diffusion facilitator CzcD-associated flavoprotein CzcO
VCTSAPGCKRLILDAGYLASLNQPNVSLRFDPLDEIVEEGVKLKSGEVVPVDVIIFGTGYNLVSSFIQVSSRG